MKEGGGGEGGERKLGQKDGRRKGKREEEGGWGGEGRREEEERERNPWLCYSITTDLEHNSVGVDACHVFHHNKVCFRDAEFDSDLPLGFYLLLVRRKKVV